MNTQTAKNTKPTKITKPVVNTVPPKTVKKEAKPKTTKPVVEPQKIDKAAKPDKIDKAAKPDKPAVRVERVAIHESVEGTILETACYDPNGGTLREQGRSLMKLWKATGNGTKLLSAGAALILSCNYFKKVHKRSPTVEELIAATQVHATANGEIGGYQPPFSKAEPRVFWSGYLTTETGVTRNHLSLSA